MTGVQTCALPICINYQAPLDASGRRTGSTDPRVAKTQNTSGTSGASDSNPVGFTKVAPSPVQDTSSASSPTSKPVTTDLTNLDIQIASSTAAPQVTSPTGGAGNNVNVADDDAITMASTFTNNTTPAVAVNTSDGGRETPADSTWTTTWI